MRATRWQCAQAAALHAMLAASLQVICANIVPTRVSKLTDRTSEASAGSWLYGRKLGGKSPWTVVDFQNAPQYSHQHVSLQPHSGLKTQAPVHTGAAFSINDLLCDLLLFSCLGTCALKFVLNYVIKMSRFGCQFMRELL
jgi:hypothetical protein